MVFESLNGQKSLQHNLTPLPKHTQASRKSPSKSEISDDQLSTKQKLCLIIFFWQFSQETELPEERWESGVATSEQVPGDLKYWLSNIEFQILSWPNIELPFKYWADQILTSSIELTKYWPLNIELTFKLITIGASWVRSQKLQGLFWVALSCSSCFELHWPEVQWAAFSLTMLWWILNVENLLWHLWVRMQKVKE